SIQVFDEKNASPYVVSKKLGQQRLLELIGGRLDNVHIGYFYDDEYFGERLRILSLLGVIGRVLFGFLKAVKPATSSQRLVDYIATAPAILSSPKILVDELSSSLMYRFTLRACDIVV